MRQNLLARKEAQASQTKPTAMDRVAAVNPGGWMAGMAAELSVAASGCGGHLPAAAVRIPGLSAGKQSLNADFRGARANVAEARRTL
jgi:hypothetical protein